MERLNLNIFANKKENNLRVLFGPVHIAGNFLGYSRGLSKLGIESKIVLTQPHSFKYDEGNIEYLSGKIDLNKVDLRLKSGKIRGSFNLSNYKFMNFIDRFDIFHFIFGYSLLPDRRDIPILKAKGKKIVMQFCGCDIRCREIINNEKRPVSVCDDCSIECLTQPKKELAAFWEENADAIISHPEYSQLLKKKYYNFIIGIDTSRWKPVNYQENSKVLIAHAPSAQDIKGTKYVIEAVDRLKSERDDFEFILLEKLPNEELKKIIERADIVIDQLMCGWYGHFAVECMALGKPVLAYFDENWRRQVPYAKDAPIFNTTKQNIYENLKKLLDNSDLRREIGRKSREYAENVHNDEKVARDLLEIYK